MSTKYSLRAASALTVVGLAGTAAAAPFVYVDLLPTGTTTHSGSQAITVTAGQTVTLDLYLKVLNANATADESVNSTQGGLKSGVGGLLGTADMSLIAGFGGTGEFGAQDPALSDVGADGDLDQPNFSPATSGFFIATAGTNYVTTNLIGTESIGGFSYTVFKVAAGSFAVSGSALAGESTVVSYIPRSTTAGVKVKSDNVIKTLSGADAGVDLSGASINFSIAEAPIPEPASLGILALGAMGLLARRRK